MPREGSEQLTAPYFDALRGYALRGPGRFHVPGHKGGDGSDPAFRDALGEQAIALDIPLITPGVDVGSQVTPLDEALQLAADAWGAKRTWFLSNGATQGNQAICLALAGMGREVIVQRNVHASTIDGLILSGLRPTWIAPELNPQLGIAHCPLPESLELALADSPGAVGVVVVSPTYYGAVADVRTLAEIAHSWDVPLIVDEAWGSHFAFHDALPEHALSAGADLVLSGTHKLVGSLGQSAMLHLAHGSERFVDETAIQRALTLVSSTSPSSLLLGSLDAARRNAATRGPALIEDAISVLAEARAAIRGLPGLEVMDDRLLQHPGVYDYDPLRLAIDVRGAQGNGYEIAAILRDQHDLHLELRGEHMLVAVFGLGESPAESCQALVQGLESAVEQLSRRPHKRPSREAQLPPRWGALAMTPRDAFFGRHEMIPIEQAVDRVAAESVAVYPPGIPNVFPGERLTSRTIDFIRRTLDQGGTVRGLSDPTAGTIRVVTEE
ncbi:MAG: aminotransferase class I/II-fold pyridoxal phosphate-dependent enzyme [Solirubrobacteraceae bacterium]